MAVRSSRIERLYKLVASPDECWTKNSVWWGTELRQTLEDGNMTPGTVFEGTRAGRIYVVVPGENGKGQKLVELEASGAVDCRVHR